MKYRNNAFYIIVPVIQIVFYIVAYELINYFAHRMGWANARGVAWGISLQFYTLIYIVIILLSNLLGYFIPKKVLLISIVSAIIFSSFVWPILDSYPYRASAIVATGVAGILIKYLFFPMNRVDKKLKEPEE